MLEVYNDSVLQKHKGSSCELMSHHFRQTALNKGPALHSPRLTKRSAVKQSCPPVNAAEEHRGEGMVLVMKSPV